MGCLEGRGFYDRHYIHGQFTSWSYAVSANRAREPDLVSARTCYFGSRLSCSAVRKMLYDLARSFYARHLLERARSGPSSWPVCRPSQFLFFLHTDVIFFSPETREDISQRDDFGRVGVRHSVGRPSSITIDLRLRFGHSARAGGCTQYVLREGHAAYALSDLISVPCLPGDNSMNAVA